jgi:hypothetical protein
LQPSSASPPARPGAMRSDPENAGIIVYGGGPPKAVAKATLFVFGDVSIPFRQNLYLQMHAAQKHPSNLVLKRGAPGTPDDYRAQYPGFGNSRRREVQKCGTSPRMRRQSRR